MAEVTRWQGPVRRGVVCRQALSIYGLRLRESQGPCGTFTPRLCAVPVDMLHGLMGVARTGRNVREMGVWG